MISQVENKSIKYLLLVALLAIGCKMTKKSGDMSWKPFLSTISNKTIKFATFRPPDAQFATLDRKIAVVGPDSVLQLIQAADTALLPVLIELLKIPQKAWAAEIILTALSDGDGKIIESFSGDPDGWWDTVGQNAYAKWNHWYLANKEKIQWDEKEKVFKIVE